MYKTKFRYLMLLIFPIVAMADIYSAMESPRITGDWNSLRTDLENNGIRFDLSYQQQWQNNFSGGKETHNADAFTGSYDFALEFNFNKLGLIQTPEFESGFYIKLKGTYNDGLLQEVGSLYSNNADAGGDFPFYLDKYYWWGSFFRGKLEFRLGVLETVKDLFDVSIYSNHEDRDFLDRASYRNILIPHITGMGAFVKCEPVNKWYVQAIGIDAHARRNHNQFTTAFHEESWFIGMWETGFTPEWKFEKGPMPGRYRIGFWYDPRSKKVIRHYEKDEDPEMEGGDVGLYLGMDQMVWKENADPKDKQGLGVFGRFGKSHGDLNKVNSYWKIGSSYRGLFPGRDNDVLGFAWSTARHSRQHRTYVDSLADEESVYEWYYSWQLTPAISVSPDLQFIRNPGGRSTDRDALVGGIRIRVVF